MFFSIIVPVYNVEEYLRDCIDSVLSQTYTDYELILVDDGSTDQSGDICDEYHSCDKRVRVIHKENGGQSSARNLGVDLAHGEFIAFLDSDDMFSDNCFLQEVYDAIDDSTEVVVYRYSKLFENGEIEEVRANLSNINCNNKSVLLSELVQRDAFFCSCWSKCVRTSVLKNGIRFDVNSSCEDMDWYYSVVSKANSFKTIDKPYVLYRQRANSVTSTFKKQNFEDFISVISRWYAIFLGIENETEKHVMLSSLAKLYCNLLISYSRHTRELKEYRKEIFAMKELLVYDLNPRTKAMRRVSRLIGLRAMCILLKVYEKVR